MLEAVNRGAAGSSGGRGEGNAEPEVPGEKFGVGLARAFAGAVIFALPMMMTMEMWWLGFYLDRHRLALLLLVAIPLLIGTSHYGGFRKTFNLMEDAVDAFVAYAVGFAAPAVVLLLFNVINLETSPGDAVGKLAVQAVPGSLGALLARSQLGGGGGQSEEMKREIGYAGEFFLMVVGALFLALNVAPTEEMILIAFKMTPWHAIALLLASLTLMHAFVYAVGFRGQATAPEGTPGWSLFLRFTLPGYVLVLLVAFFVLWLFGRTTGVADAEVLKTSIVLGFPASIGAAAARLIL